MIKYYKPAIGQEEKDAVSRVLESGWLTTGEEVKAFEEEFAAANGSKHALAVNSATSGLRLAIACSPYHMAIIPNYTFIATLEAAYREGKAVRLVGTPYERQEKEEKCTEENISFKNDYNVKFSSIDNGTVIPVHIGGELCAFENSGKRFIVEDCAHRFPGNTYKKGEIQVFSFYANKPITCGEGGMICTDSSDLYERMKSIYYHGMDKTRYERGSNNYSIIKIGYKYNLSDIQAAIGREQLKKMPYLKERRQEIAYKYIEAFEGTPIKTRPINGDNSWHLFMIYCESVEQAERIKRAMEEHEIEYSQHYQPLSTWESVRDIATFSEQDHRVDMIKYNLSISLPIYPDLSGEEQAEIIDCIKGAI